MKIKRQEIKTKKGVPRVVQIKRIRQIDDMIRCASSTAEDLYPLYITIHNGNDSDSIWMPKDIQDLEKVIVDRLNVLRNHVHEESWFVDGGCLIGAIEPQDDKWGGDHCDEIKLHLSYGDTRFA